MIGEVKDKDVIIVDDLIDTGGTIAMASNVIMDKGAKSVRAIITHPVLSGNAEENLENSSLIELVVTDSIPLNIRNKKIKVLSIAGLFAKAIRKIFLFLSVPCEGSFTHVVRVHVELLTP